MATFFQQNETVLVFTHGIILFALGFAAWLQRRRATRFTLTSSLIWLASYAFIEAWVIWGFVFIPIQSTYLAPEVIQALVVLRAVLQLVAVVFLLQFGLRLVPWTQQRLRAFSIASVVVCAAVIISAGTFSSGKQPPQRCRDICFSSRAPCFRPTACGGSGRN
ncbi:MAG: hypothetical protein O2976_02230 [Actinomycetota bacterium]|nr:hypothetical protein [Actinomycetota bacterium]